MSRNKQKRAKNRQKRRAARAKKRSKGTRPTAAPRSGAAVVRPRLPDGYQVEREADGAFALNWTPQPGHRSYFVPGAWSSEEEAVAAAVQHHADHEGLSARARLAAAQEGDRRACEGLGLEDRDEQAADGQWSEDQAVYDEEDYYDELDDETYRRQAREDFLAEERLRVELERRLIRFLIDSAFEGNRNKLAEALAKHRGAGAVPPASLDAVLRRLRDQAFVEGVRGEDGGLIRWRATPGIRTRQVKPTSNDWDAAAAFFADRAASAGTGLDVAVNEQRAKICKLRGYADVPGLFDLSGRRLEAMIRETRWGANWAVFERGTDEIAAWVSCNDSPISDKKREKKGFVQKTESVRIWAKLPGRGTRRPEVIVYREDGGWPGRIVPVLV